MTTQTPQWFVLDGPASYAHVTAEWVPAGTGEGHLTIRLTRSASGREESAVYAVEEQTPDANGRVFLLLKTTDPDGAEPHCLRVGRVTDCTCTAARTRRGRCRHEFGILKLIEEGLL